MFGQFNVNEWVKVKLTEQGLAILKSQHDELRRDFPKLKPWKPPAVDAEGYSKFQLWELMNRFGESVSIGCKLPFETMIRLTIEPIVDHDKPDGIEATF
jgi:hypothetical protein